MFGVDFGVSSMRVDLDAGREPALGGSQRRSRRQARDVALWLTTLTNFAGGLSIKAAGFATSQEAQIRINSRPVPLNELEKRLASILKERAEKTVFIKARKTLAYGDVVRIVDIAKSAGAQPIGLQIDYLQ